MNALFCDAVETKNIGLALHQALYGAGDAHRGLSGRGDMAMDHDDAHAGAVFSVEADPAPVCMGAPRPCTRVLLAEGHWAMRAGLRAALGGNDGVHVVGEAGDAHETMRRVAELAPDVVLLSMNLPGGDVLNVARLISQTPAVRVLLLAERQGGVAVRHVIEAGCAGLLCADLSRQELVDALRCVHAGRVYLDAAAARELAQPAKAPMACPMERLSPRERAVFLLVADGHTNRSMGDSLGLSTKTVEKHRAAVMTKLRLASALDLRIKALDLKLCGRTPPAPGADTTQTPEAAGPVCGHAGCPAWCGADFRATPQARSQDD